MPEWVGKTLGKVRIDLLLARGGMAEVYLGTHTTLQRPAAVKLLRNQFQDEPDLLDRFQREARVVAMLRHPNIVQVYDYDVLDGQPYLVMEYVPGTSLSAYLRALHKDNGRLDFPQMDHLLTSLAGALQYAHESGVIHRDVKPGNILLTSRSTPVMAGKPLPSDAEPVLTDFGLVRFLHSTTQTTTGRIAGTPAYMSPEQARGERVDERSDIYSLGVVLYEILAGRVPFEADTTMGVLLKHINEPPPPIPGLSPLLQEVIDRALAKDPRDRFQTPTEFASAFHAAVEEKAEASTLLPLDLKTTSLPPRTVSSGRRQRGWIPAALMAAAVLLTGTFFALRAFPIATPPPPAETPTEIPTAATEALPPPPAEGPIGKLRFQDGAAVVDQVTMTALGMPPPPEGNQYEVWLTGGEERRSLGVLRLDEKGQGTLTFVDGQGRNLLERFDMMEITLEPSPDPNPNPSNEVAFSNTLPPKGLVHVRHLLVSFKGAPNGTALIQGLYTDAKLVDQAAQAMLPAFEAGDEASVRLNAEQILNVLVGNQSENYRDWNGDQQVTDPGDGYGLLLNGDNVGYIEAAYSHADYAATAPDATDNMIVHGEHVKIATQNMEEWAPQLRDLMMTILSSPFGAEMEEPIRQAVALADKMLVGIDLNGNERVEPIPGEGGALTAYQHAYYMADITIPSSAGQAPPPGH